MQWAQDEQPLPLAAASSLVLKQAWPVRVETDLPGDLHPPQTWSYLWEIPNNRSIRPRQTGNCKRGKAGLLVTSGRVPLGTYWGPSRQERGGAGGLW